MVTTIKEVFYDTGEIKSREYIVNAKLHREDGPAYLVWDKTGILLFESYYQNFKLHREEGAAMVVYNQLGEITINRYYINGKELSEQEFMSQRYPTKSAYKS